MKEKIAAKRYGDAFISYAKESIGTERAVDELKNLKLVIHSNPAFEKFLYNPQIPNKEKYAVIDKVFVEEFSQEAAHFLKLLLDKERIKIIFEICDYVRVAYAHGETVEALLKTSYPMDLELIQEIKKKIEIKLQKKLNLYLDLDPDLLGGAQIRIGNFIIDGSVRGRLEELKEKLKAVKI